jgi:hypothetical protein
MRLFFTTTTLALACFSTLAMAVPAIATLNGIDGKVLVNQGSGFVPASGDLPLTSGQKVMVGKDASASLVLENLGCSIALPAGRVTVISNKLTCDDVTTAIDKAGLTITPTSGQVYPGNIPPKVAAALFITAVAGASIYAAVAEDPVSSP